MVAIHRMCDVWRIRVFGGCREPFLLHLYQLIGALMHPLRQLANRTRQLSHLLVKLLSVIGRAVT
jgi:hypothetical protein